MTRFAAILATTLLVMPALAQTIDQRIDKELPGLLATYKSLHEAPELSMQEAKTSSLVASRLKELGYEVAYPVGKYDAPNTTCYGVVAVMKNGKGPTVLVRTDMDALPVTEATGLPYASTVRAKNPTGDDVGVMHACGHDIHMTTLLGTAKLMADLKSQWHGTLMLVGQPAEEIVAGAKGMLAGNLYQRFGKPDFVVSFHDTPLLPAGQVGYTPGWFMAASDSLNVTIRGVGGHGANPQATKDPVVAAAEFITQLQTIASRERSPLDPVVVTVGAIHGGTKRNIIPDEVKLYLTVRTFDPEVRKRTMESISRIAKGVALAAGIPDSRAPIIEEITDEHSEATYNDPALTQRLVGVLKKTIGDSNVIEMKPLTVSEDVNRFGLDRTIPLVMFNLGAVDAAKLAQGPVPGLHSSGFAPVPEPTIRTGMKSMTAMLFDLLR